MGGLALKHLGVKRVDSTEYIEITREVAEKFFELFNQDLHIVESYFDKTDFGDCDAVIVGSTLPSDWREQLSRNFDSPGMVKNGDVTSIAIRDVQFDFISVPANRVVQAATYFAFNDLGNLMGRIAHKMGFKYGHLGFQLVVRNDHHVLASLDPEARVSDVFDFMGYDYMTWQKGFTSLQSIFQYAATSQYFSPEIYLLHNRNAVSRIRDAKRKTYTDFLKWCETYSGPAWPWADPDNIQHKIKEKEYHKQRAFERWPHLRFQLEQVMRAEKTRLQFVEKFNGHLVSSWTNLRGQQLGSFMAWLKKMPKWETLPQETSEQIKVWVKSQLVRWLASSVDAPPMLTEPENLHWQHP